MKTKLLSTLILLLYTMMHSCVSDDGFEIRGHIHGIEEPQLTLYIEYPDSIRSYTANTTNGHFNFKGKVAHPCMATLYGKNAKGIHTGEILSFMIENTPIYIDGNSSTQSHIKVYGSNSQLIYSRYKAQDDSLRNRWANLYRQYDRMPINSLEERNALREEMNHIHCELRPQLIMEYIKTDPSSYAVARIALHNSLERQLNEEDWKLYYEALDSVQQNSVYGQELRQRF